MVASAGEGYVSVPTRRASYVVGGVLSRFGSLGSPVAAPAVLGLGTVILRLDIGFLFPC